MNRDDNGLTNDDDDDVDGNNWNGRPVMKTKMYKEKDELVKRFLNIIRFYKNGYEKKRLSWSGSQRARTSEAAVRDKIVR